MTLRTTRWVAGAAVVAAVALVSNALFLVPQWPALLQPPAASVTFFENRFAPLRDALPRDRTVGYVTNLNPNDTRSYYMARYVLSPVRVAWQTPCDTMIGDFYVQDLRPVKRWAEQQGFDVVREFGDGVMLLRRKGATP